MNEFAGAVIGILFTIFVLYETWTLGNMFIIRKKKYRGTREQIREWKKHRRERWKKQRHILAGMIIK